MPASKDPRIFGSAAAFRTWLARSHRTSTELVVRCFKTSASARGISYADALHEALCFGWIDGVRRSHDEVSFTIRFTPRKRGSIWSLVNVAKAEMLIREGRMAPAGLAAFKARDPAQTGLYSFERAPTPLPRAYVQRFKAKPGAWEWFQSRPPGYRRTATHWVLSAKRPETRDRRLAELIADSAAGRKIKPLARPGER
jgi:uncharacterized protein YdeI (YjbR/CyaY-like superfamily)